MPIRTIVLYGYPGTNEVQASELIGVQPLLVTRSLVLHDDVFLSPFPESDPGNRQFKYFGGLGTIVFDPANPFTGPTIGRPNRNFFEKVVVMYKALI